MSKVAQMLFGGAGGSNDAARAEARADAEKSRQLQQIANDRQLAQLNETERRAGASRRAPRGRRLFLTGEDNGGLAQTLGG